MGINGIRGGGTGGVDPPNPPRDIGQHHRPDDGDDRKKKKERPLDDFSLGAMLTLNFDIHEIRRRGHTPEEMYHAMQELDWQPARIVEQMALIGYQVMADSTIRPLHMHGKSGCLPIIVAGALATAAWISGALGEGKVDASANVSHTSGYEE